MKFIKCFLLIATCFFSTSCAPEGDLIFTPISETECAVSIGGAVNKKNIVIPSTYGKYTVTQIGDSTIKTGFGVSKKLESIELPDTIECISDFAFYDCYSLTSISIPKNVMHIGKNAFSRCDSLESVVFDSNSNLEVIPFFAFDFCYSLKTINLPNSLKSIGYCAFRGCESLENITLPNGLISIGDYAFYECNSITSMYIPESVTYIGLYSLNCEVLKFLTLPILCDKNGNDLLLYQFFGNYQLPNQVLEEVVILDTCKGIGTACFRDWASIKTITLGANISYIGTAAFMSCYSLTTLNFEGTVEQWMNIEKGDWWNMDAPVSIVNCSDGVAQIEQVPY